MKSANPLLVSALPPRVFVKMFLDAIFMSGTNSAPRVSGPGRQITVPDINHGQILRGGPGNGCIDAVYDLPATLCDVILNVNYSKRFLPHIDFLPNSASARPSCPLKMIAAPLAMEPEPCPVHGPCPISPPG